MTKILPDHAFETVKLEPHSEPNVKTGNKIAVTFVAKTVDGATLILEPTENMS